MGDLLRRYKATAIAAVILVVVLLACFAVARSISGAGGGEARYVALVHDGDGVVHTLPLDEDAELSVVTSLGSNTIVVEDGQVRMAEADCPSGDCLTQRAISHPGEQIICLPHQLWIEIVSEGDESGEMDVDAVGYGDVDTVAR